MLLLQTFEKCYNLGDNSFEILTLVVKIDHPKIANICLSGKQGLDLKSICFQEFWLESRC